ncbi:MAG: hypothetical protein QG621_216, partial [Patescibacteria group bacterium]|nr:hypothetical protein [Patescibacteria group bacterium]
MFLRARAKRSLLKILVFVLLTSTGFYTAFRVGDTSVSAEGTVTNLTTGTAASGLSWYAITSSSDGTKLAAAETGSGDIWTSADSGSTWTNQTTGTGASGHVWYSIAGSLDGTKLAALEPSGDIWTSTDSGETWTNQTIGTGATSQYWQSVASSADGTKLVAVTAFGDGSTGDIWTS